VVVIVCLLQSVLITTNVGRLNPAHGEVYSFQHYVMIFISYLRKVGGFPVYPFYTKYLSSGSLITMWVNMMTSICILPACLRCDVTHADSYQV
jgi:hypothetical protein